MIDQLSNRDLAFISCSIIGIILLIFLIKKNPESKYDIANIFKSFSNKWILIPLLIYSIYFFLIIYILYHNNIWNYDLLKDSIIWYLSFFFFTYLTLQKVENVLEFKLILFDLFKITIIIDFFINSYTFNFLIEFILTFLIITLNFLLGFSGDDKNSNYAKKLFKILLFFISIIYILNVVYNFDSEQNLTNKKLMELVLPFLLGLSIVPFLFFTILILQYEKIYKRVNCLIFNIEDNKRAKKNIFKVCKLSLVKIFKLVNNNVFDFDLETLKKNI